MNKMILVVVFIFTGNFLVAQNIYIDSLNNRLKLTNISTSEKMKIYNQLVDQLRMEMMYNEAYALNKKYLALAKSVDAQTDITKAYVNAGIISVNQSEYDKSEAYIDSIAISSANDKDAEVYAEYFLFYYAKSLRDFKKAMTHGLRSLSLLEQTKGDPLLEFKLYYQFYGIYTEWNDIPNSKKYAQKAIEAALKSDNKNNLSDGYSAMAVVYAYEYQKSQADDDFAKMLEYCERSTSLYTQYPGRVSGNTYSIARNNTANYLLQYAKRITPEIRQQIEYNIMESLAISSKLKHGQSTQTASLGMLSNLAKHDGDWDKAERYMLKAYSVLLTQNPIYYHIMSRVVSELADIYEHKGDLKNALDFQKKHHQYRALLFDQSEAESVKQLEAQYQSQKKEQEIIILKEREENQRKQKLLYGGLGIIGLVGSFYMFRSYHFRLRYSLEREKKLNTEKQEAELEAKLEKEEQSRLKAEQALLALQQQKLQDEVMINKLQIHHKNNVLLQVKEKLKDETSADLKQIIREENLLDNDFEKAKFQIQEIHPSFYMSLRANAKQKLTLLDLKYCAYYYLGMETKQIAKMLNVEPKSVRMTKYRLKQKLGLDAEIDLVEYLKHISVS